MTCCARVANPWPPPQRAAALPCMRFAEPGPPPITAAVGSYVCARESLEKWIDGCL